MKSADQYFIDILESMGYSDILYETTRGQLQQNVANNLNQSESQFKKAAKTIGYGAAAFGAGMATGLPVIPLGAVAAKAGYHAAKGVWNGAKGAINGTRLALKGKGDTSQQPQKKVPRVNIPAPASNSGIRVAKNGLPY